MMDTVISVFGSASQNTNTVYYGKIVECTQKRVGRRDNYAVTDIVIKNAQGYRMLSVSLPAGLLLYDCISHDNRIERMNSITFCFTVIDEKQHIIDFIMHDASEWIGDTLDREEKHAKFSRQRKSRAQKINNN